MGKTIKSSTCVYEVIKPHIHRQGEQEECFIISLNRSNVVKDIHLMSIGDDASTIIPIKNILKQSILDVASGIILIHTHPSGDSTPSNADVNNTKKLKDALNICDINLIDHIVIGDDNYYSFSEEQTYRVK